MTKRKLFHTLLLTGVTLAPNAFAGGFGSWPDKMYIPTYVAPRPVRSDAMKEHLAKVEQHNAEMREVTDKILASAFPMQWSTYDRMKAKIAAGEGGYSEFAWVKKADQVFDRQRTELLTSGGLLPMEATYLEFTSEKPVALSELRLPIKYDDLELVNQMKTLGTIKGKSFIPSEVAKQEENFAKLAKLQKAALPLLTGGLLAASIERATAGPTEDPAVSSERVINFKQAPASRAPADAPSRGADPTYMEP